MKRTILVVDDNVVIRSIARAILERAGYLVEVAGNGSEALSVLRRWVPDMLLTDMVMPEKEAPELIMEVRREYPKCAHYRHVRHLIGRPGPKPHLGEKVRRQ